MRRHHSLGIVTLLLALATAGLCTLTAQAEPSERDEILFDTMYRDKLIAVRRSRDSRDDVELIGNMLGAADAIPDSPGVQQLIYREVMKLGEGSGHYHEVVVAATRLREQFPEDPAGSKESLMPILEKGYRGTRGEEQAEIAELYLGMLAESAREALEQDDLDRAGDLYSKALGLARAIGSARLVEIEDAVAELADIKLRVARIIQLERVVKNKPEHKTAARDLIMGLMIDMDEPERAAAYVEHTLDPDLVDVVHFAAEDIEQISPAKALRVADWYLAEARAAKGLRSERLYERALKYYSAMLDKYARDDALRKRVELMHRVANRELTEMFEQ